MWVEIEVQVMWCGLTSCARGCQFIDSFVESDLQCSVAGSHDGYCRDAEVMEEDPL